MIFFALNAQRVAQKLFISCSLSLLGKVAVDQALPNNQMLTALLQRNQVTSYQTFTRLLLSIFQIQIFIPHIMSIDRSSLK